MARANSTRASDAPRDAVALLKQDHRQVEALFDEFEEADESEQSTIAQRVCQMLTVHAQIEEEILYPAAKEALEDEEEVELVTEANVEHSTAKDLIARIEGMTTDDEQFKATVKVLSEYIKHHVKEEEGELFPALRKTELDLKEMGARLSERKYALMEEMGLSVEEEQTQTSTRKKSGGRSKSSGGRGRQAAGRRSSSRSSSSRSARH